jgi:hypothetical protein
VLMNARQSMTLHIAQSDERISTHFLLTYKFGIVVYKSGNPMHVCAETNSRLDYLSFCPRQSIIKARLGD